MSDREKFSYVSDLVRKLPFSGIRKFFDVANEIEGVISLGVGEPDFDTPWNVREEGVYNLEYGKTIYSSNSGLMELRQEIARYMNRKYELEYDAKSEILVTVGGSEAIDLSFRSILNPGDEVLVVEPCFVSYKPCVLLAGGVPVVIEAKAEFEFRVQPEQIEEKITPRTKAIIISYPSNPTGAVMTRADLEGIAAVLRGRDILVVSDEVYSELTYSDERHVSIAEIDGMYDKTIVVNGFSKAFAMTGWRLGFACGPAEIISAMTKVHQYAIMCAPTTAQYAGIEALRNCDDAVARMRLEYNARRNVMISGFRNMGLSVFEPRGAFYIFPSIRETGMNSEDFCQALLREKKIAAVPGTAFGDCGDGFIRVSYAYSLENLKLALSRIEEFVQSRL